MTDNVTVILEGEHSPWGPSSGKRGVNCSGSMQASKGAPDDESIYAAEGTAAHYLSELARKHGQPCIDWLGHKFKVGKYIFEVDEEMADSAQAFVDWCAESPGVPLTEQRINYSAYFPPEAIKEFGEAFGTLDDARLNHDIVAIKDFKHGKGVQEWASENIQLKLQALGVLEDFGYLYDIKGFNLGICQPRLNHFDTWDISVEALVVWAKETLPGWAARAALGIDFKAGDWCRFCRIRRKCAVRANTGAQLMLDEGEFEDLDNLEVNALRARNAGHMITTQQLAKILPALDIFKAWIKDMEKRAISELLAGDAVMRESWKLVEGRSNRRWKASDEVVVEVAIAHKIDPYKPSKLKSVAEIEKEIGKKVFNALLADEAEEGRVLVEKPQGKPKLAPVSDRREEITGQSLVEFDNLDEVDDD